MLRPSLPSPASPRHASIAVRTGQRPRRALGVALVMGASLVVLTACSESARQGDTDASATPAPTATAQPGPPALVPEGSAEENLPLFTEVAQAVWASPENAQGRAYVDALTAAGFDKAAMQVTADQSTIGNPAEALQFSVRWGEECLLGQAGPVTGTVVTTVAAGLAGGGCLLGETRPIDW